MIWLALLVLLACGLGPLDHAPPEFVAEDPIDNDRGEPGEIAEPNWRNVPTIIELEVKAYLSPTGDRTFWLEATNHLGETSCICEAESMPEIMFLTEGLIDLGDPRLRFAREVAN